MVMALSLYGVDQAASYTLAPSCARLGVSVALAGVQPRALGVTRLMATSGEGASAEPAVKPMKSKLMRLLSKGTGLKGAADAANRAEVNELVLGLEKNNPTEEPAASELLNGGWEMIYTGGYAQGFIDSPTRELALLVYTGGFKPGLLANLMDKLPPGLLDVDYVDLKISPDEPRVEASLKVGVAGNTQQITTEGSLIQQSPVRLRETFKRARAFGQAVDLPGSFMLSRDLLVTFLDDDLLIARDESGSPDVWLRKVPMLASTQNASASAVDTAASAVNGTQPVPAAADADVDVLVPADLEGNEATAFASEASDEQGEEEEEGEGGPNLMDKPQR